MIIWTFGQSVLFSSNKPYIQNQTESTALWGNLGRWWCRPFLLSCPVIPPDYRFWLKYHFFYLSPELYRHSNIISKKFEKVEILDFYSISYFYRKKEQKQEKEPLSRSPIKFSPDQIHISLQFHPKKFSKLWKAVLDSYSRVVILASDRVLL